MEFALVGHSDAAELTTERERLPRLPPKPTGPSPKKPGSIEPADPPSASATETPTPATRERRESMPGEEESLSPLRARRSLPASSSGQPSPPKVTANGERRAVTRRQTRERFKETEIAEQSAQGEPAAAMVTGEAPEPTGVPPRQAKLRSKVTVEIPVTINTIKQSKSNDKASKSKRKRVSFGADVVAAGDGGTVNGTPVAAPAPLPERLSEVPSTPEKSARKRRRKSSGSAADLPKPSKIPRTTGSAAVTTIETPETASLQPPPVRPTPVQAEVPKTPKSKRRRTSTISAAAPRPSQTPVDEAKIAQIIANAVGRRRLTSSQPSSAIDSSPRPGPDFNKTNAPRESPDATPTRKPSRRRTGNREISPLLQITPKAKKALTNESSEQSSKTISMNGAESEGPACLTFAPIVEDAVRTASSSDFPSSASSGLASDIGTSEPASATSTNEPSDSDDGFPHYVMTQSVESDSTMLLLRLQQVRKELDELHDLKDEQEAKLKHYRRRYDRLKEKSEKQQQRIDFLEYELALRDLSRS